MEKGVLATRVWKYGPHKNAGVRMCVCVCVYVFFWGGGGGTLTFRRVVEKRESPDFRSLEVGILI